MPKYLVAALCVTAIAAVAAVAAAQTYPLPVLALDAGLTPTNAGTKKKPKSSKVRLKVTLQREARVTADQLVFHLPRHARVSGKGFAYCPATELDKTKNPNKCPSRSKVGVGTATAVFGQDLAPIRFNVTVFAGSRDELGIWMQSTNVPLAKAMRGIVSDSGSPYNQKVTIDIPPELRRYLGSFVHLTSFDVTVGATNGRKGRRRRALIATVGCPKSRLHRFEARVRLIANPVAPAKGEAVATDASRCSR